MGWTFLKEPVEDLDMHLREAVGEDLAGFEVTVLDMECVHSVAYMAVQLRGFSDCVMGVVVPHVNNAERGFGYRVLTEIEGPVYVECPDRIMKQLSPIKDLPERGLARSWRHGVRRERRTQGWTRLCERHRGRGQGERDR